VLVAYPAPKDTGDVDPLILTNFPVASPEVAVAAKEPVVLVMYTPDKLLVVEAVALLDIVTVVPTTEDTVVLAGMPVPVMVWPAPTRTLLDKRVRVGLPLVVLADAVNTPTLDMVRLAESPGNVPKSTGVLVVDVM
jgi:hypothetical protein